MAEQRRFHTEITADDANFEAAMERAAQKAMSDAQRMQSEWRGAFNVMGNDSAGMVQKLNTGFDAVKETVKGLRGAISAALGVLGAGSFIGKAIGNASADAVAAERLGNILGITVERASELRIALNDVEVEQDAYTALVAKMTGKLRENEQGLRANEDRFKALGVVTRDANGNLLDGEQLMRNGARALLQFKEGTDRNLASIELFGRGWEEVQKILRLTPEIMENARKKGEDLQTTIGPRGAERAREYRLAVNDLKDVFEAIGNRIAQALMPVLTDLSNWFSDKGPGAVNVMRGALGGLLTFVYAVENGIVVIVRTLSSVIYTVVEPFAGLLEAAYLASTGKLEEASNRIKAITANLRQNWDEEFSAILKNSDEFRQRMQDLFDPKAEQGTTKPKPDAGTRTWAPAQSGNRMAEFEAMLAQEREAYENRERSANSFREYSKKQEAAFWEEILNTERLTMDERTAVMRKYLAAQHEVRKQDFEAEIAGIKARMDSYRQGSTQRIALAQQVADRMAMAYGKESTQFAQAQSEINRLMLERVKMMQQLGNMAIDRERENRAASLAVERERLDSLAQLGLIKDTEKLQALKILRASELAIDIQAEEAKAQLYKDDEIQYQQHLDRIKALKEKHAIDQKKLDGQIALEQKKTLDTILNPIGDAVQGMVNGVLQGTQTMQQMFRNALIGIASQYMATLIKMGLEWVKHEILKTNATAAASAARTGVEAGAAATSTSITAGTTIKSIGMKAWDAAAGVYASIAAIPVIGPFLAPAMALAAAATVVGFIGKIATASQGFSVPSGVNPITQLHQEEMVLPADIANPLRQQLAGGGGGVGGPVIKVYALDARSFVDFARRNKNGLGVAARDLGRNFVRPMP